MLRLVCKLMARCNYCALGMKTVRDHANDKTQHVVPGMAATVAKRHSVVMLAM